MFLCKKNNFPFILPFLSLRYITGPFLLALLYLGWEREKYTCACLSCLEIDAGGVNGYARFYAKLNFMGTVFKYNSRCSTEGVSLTKFINIENDFCSINGYL